VRASPTRRSDADAVRVARVPTATFLRCCVLASFAITLGVTLHHAQLAALAAPFVVAPSLYLGRIRGDVVARLEVSEDVAQEDDNVQAKVTITARDIVDLLVVKFDPGSLSTAGADAVAIALSPGETRTASFELKAGHWGRHFVGPAAITLYTPAILQELPVARTRSARVVVEPRVDHSDLGEDVPNSLLFAGAHRSGESGFGATFSHIRPFHSGDALRRINWRATLKAGELHVTSTHAEQSTRVIIAIDAARDSGPKGQSVLDVSVRAAATIAEHYIDAGDMVGVVECATRGRLLRAAPGQRQEDRIREWLLDLRSTGVAQRAELAPWLSDMRVSRSLLAVLTPLLDDEAARNLLALRQRGASLMCIDTLSVEAQPDSSDRVSEVARRLWLLERARVVHRLADAGIPVVAWNSSASLESVLRDVTRIASAPRLTAS
jgi:uncharacterized protein (DUF58 family)